jgi:hypothetical protein
MASRPADDHDLLGGIGLNFGEAALLCEALATIWQTPGFTERMWSDVREVSHAMGLDEKWSASSDQLFERLGKMKPEEALALMRAALQFSQRRNEPTARLLRDLGLLAAGAGAHLPEPIASALSRATASMKTA